VTIAPGTVLGCGGWYQVASGDTCGNITLNAGISLTLFSVADPSINTSDCSSSLIVGDAYCVAPLPPIGISTEYTWNAFGCWSNADPASAVLKRATFTNTAAMTIEECAQFRFQGDYSFFGLPNSDQCSCDFELGINYVQVSSSQCNMVYAGDSSEICGGSSVVSLFGGPTTLFFQYGDQGCFSDSASIRALSGTSLLGNSGNSVEAYAAFCLPTYSFFGVENGQDCWCGNSIGSSCNTNCTEPDGGVCGGSSAIEIYGVKTSFTISSTSTSTSTSSTIQSSSSSSTTTT
jgi:hypothetical protein